MIVLALLLHAAQPAAAPPARAPDIQLDLRASARRVVVEREGELDLTVRTSVNGREGENNAVEVQAPEAPEGRTRLDNVRVRVRAEARIADPLAAALNASAAQEPPPPR